MAGLEICFDSGGFDSSFWTVTESRSQRNRVLKSQQTFQPTPPTVQMIPEGCRDGFATARTNRMRDMRLSVQHHGICGSTINLTAAVHIDRFQQSSKPFTYKHPPHHTVLAMAPQCNVENRQVGKNTPDFDTRLPADTVLESLV